MHIPVYNYNSTMTACGFIILLWFCESVCVVVRYVYIVGAEWSPEPYYNFTVHGGSFSGFKWSKHIMSKRSDQQGLAN